uniref:Uncharacterized protein n=1 Tax=Aegilops tauschii TaxID=37682 RepID=M8B8R1_AEGTA
MGSSVDIADVTASVTSVLAVPDDKPAFQPLDPEDVRAYLHKAVDFVSDYYANVESMPVLPDVKPGYLQASFKISANEEFSVERTFRHVACKKRRAYGVTWHQEQIDIF